ncbi:hypothetical protein PVAP13_8NG339160 [Panicum virgatum]|uniref:Uncharacterized protein n=1 Tax=Panicum virgatum TaxID=38727 RepID=A0A8T0PAG0_PANVG|nr:hypothetical protein PVAP13_8NG339160 [Panicum virgatum]
MAQAATVAQLFLDADPSAFACGRAAAGHRRSTLPPHAARPLRLPRPLLALACPCLWVSERLRPTGGASPRPAPPAACAPACTRGLLPGRPDASSRGHGHQLQSPFVYCFLPHSISLSHLNFSFAFIH